MTQSIEITDPESGEVFELKTGMLVSNVRDLFMTRRRNDIMKGSWANLSEDDQQDEIVAVTEMARAVIEKIVEVVATAGRDVVHAKLDKFVIKDGAVQLTATGIADDGVVLALNHVGNKAVKIIVADADDYDKERDDMDAMPDQSTMFADGDDTAEKLDESPEIEGDIPETEDPKEIGEAMDADLEQLEDGDDLHADDETSKAVDVDREQAVETGEPLEDASPKDMGSAARLAGAGPDENPFEGGSDDAIAWSEGYDHTDGEIKALKGQGHAAADAGEDRHGGKWKEGTDARRFWLEGYDEFEQPTSDKTSDGADDPIETDSFAAGVTAAERGESEGDNPHEEGSVQYRYWDQGFDSFTAGAET